MDENVINSAVKEGMKDANNSNNKELGKLAVELWKIEKKLGKSKEKLSEEENKSFEFLFNRVNQILGNCNIKITDFVNQKWNDGMALLDIISVEEVEGLEFPVIGETISPLVEINGEIAQRSKVVIYKPMEKKEVNEPETIEELAEKKNTKKGLRAYLVLLLLSIVLIIICIFILRHKCLDGDLGINTEKELVNGNENQIEDVDLIDAMEDEENKEEINDENMEINDENIETNQEPIDEVGMEVNGENVESENIVEDVIENNEINNEEVEEQSNLENI